jgi:hypothetical protein
MQLILFENFMFVIDRNIVPMFSAWPDISSIRQ